jgi:amino acid adenylation domain-containing protein
MQEAMWRAHVASARPGTDIEQLIIRFHEPVRIERFMEAWRLVIARTPALRSRFTWDRDGVPHLWFDADAAPAWNEVDLGALPDEWRDGPWRQVVEDDRKRGFDLREGPLLRFIHTRFGESDVRVAWTFHHVLLDGRSIPMVMEDVFAAWRALESGSSPVLPERGGFDEFLRWRLAWWAAQAPAAEAFWREAFAGAARQAPLAHDRSPGARTPQGEVRQVNFQWSAQNTGDLRDRAAALGVTVNTVIQTAWGLALRSHCRQDDIVFSAVRAGRGGTVPGADSIPGLFMTSLPVRFDIDPATKSGDALRMMRSRSLALRAFEHTPLGDAAQWSGGGGESIVVFDHESVVDRLAAACGDGGRRTFELVEQPDRPLLLAVHERPVLRGCLLFDGARFPAPAMERLARQVAHLAAAVVFQPGTPLCGLPLLPPDQELELAGLGCGRATNNPGLLLHEWFELRAREKPDAIAVRTPERSVSYGSLDAEAARLAVTLRRMGAGPGRLVAILLPRGAELVATILGVLKSGAAYAPIDPSSPPARVTGMLAVADPAAVIALGPPGDVQPPARARWLDLGASLPAAVEEAPPAPGRAAREDDLAYAVFTSGSSGEPKLVGVEHRGISNLLQFATTELFEPADLRCVPFTTAVGFDACVHQIFATLALGGTLVPLPDLLAIGASPFWDQFTWVGATPAGMERLIDAHGLPPSVRLAGLGAEAIPQRLIDRLRALPSLRDVYNFYGPTETTVYCTVARLSASARDGAAPEIDGLKCAGRIVGRPVANTRVAILQPDGRPAPRGVPGELVVSGAGVARGYLNDEDRTLAKFGHLNGLDMGRAYRTGDWVRWTEDGSLEFLGRGDSQVKVNGVRIELEEVEHHLAAFPGVTGAAAASRPGPNGATRLSGYVVMPAAAFDARSILRFLHQRLPPAVVPDVIIRLESLPLTAAGKLDRRALPPPGEGGGPADGGDVTPRTVTETRLLEAWARILRRSDVKMDEGFYAAGGDSLQAVLLLISVEGDFGVKLSPADLQEAPSPREFAARIDRALTERAVESAGEGARRRGRLGRMQSGDRRPLIVAIPGGAGDGQAISVLPGVFAQLSAHEVVCFQPAPLDHRCTPRRNRRMLAGDLIDGFWKLGVGPADGVLIWAHCCGAALALELARQVRSARGRAVPVALLDPPPPTPRWSAACNALAYTRLGTQLRYHANMLTTGSLAARATYMAGVCRRAFLRTVARQSSASAAEAGINRTYQDWMAYPRAALSRPTRHHTGPLLITVNTTEATPNLHRAWRAIARGAFRWDTVDGDHLTSAAKHPGQVAESLRRWMEELEGRF